MVLLHVKKGDESQFLVDTTVAAGTTELLEGIVRIYNGRLKINRVCTEIEELAKHGTYLPREMIGLTDEQIQELKLVDIWEESCTPSGGVIFNKDPIGRRNGRGVNERMREVLTRTVGEVKAVISKKQVEAGISLNEDVIKEQLNLLRGAVTIVYPMGLPPHDPIRREFENSEDLSGTQDSLHVIELADAELWFCGKLIHPGKKLGDFIGNNEKSKVIVKIQRRGQGPPGREPVMSEEDQKRLMLQAYKRQEELKINNKRVTDFDAKQ